MITNEQALELLMFAIVGDNRGVHDSNITLWREVSRQGGWTYEQGFRAVIEHRTFKPGVYLEAGHITQRVAEVRKDIRARWYCPAPPRELADDPAAEIAWRRRAAAEYVERNLALWAAGEPLDDAQSPLDDLAEKRGLLPAATGEASDARRAAVLGMRRFAAKTAVPEESPADRAAARAARVARWAAVDGCPSCDDEGMRAGVVCDHVEPQREAS